MMFREPLPPISNDEVTDKIKDENIRSTFRRLDCRKNNQIRDMFLKLGDIDTADGYCFYSLGNTKVLCTICGPKPENRGSYSEIGRVRLKVATLKQNPLDNAYEKRDKEIEALLIEVINRIIFLDKYKGCCIFIRCIILKGDGGELSAVLTSISLALIKAGIETRDIISSISVCLLRCLKTNRTFNLVDLDETELTYYRDKYEINLLTLGICFNAKTVCFFNGTCSSINNKSFAEILNFAEGACRALGDMLKKSVQEHILKKHFSLPGLKKLRNKRNRKKEEESNTNDQKTFNQLTDKTTKETNNERKNDFKREDTETEEEAIERIVKIHFKKERKCIDITGSSS